MQTRRDEPYACFRMRVTAGLAVIIAVSGAGCIHLVIPGVRVPGLSAVPHPASFIAGAAKVDLTPPPGHPTMGYGPAGQLTRGYWNRLYARAFFFEDSEGRPFVLVSCDLLAIPEGLHDAVVRKAAKQLRGQVALSAEAVVIAATHTHHGPGNFHSSQLYNDFASSYTGFDRRLFDHLSDRIAQAIVDAADRARSAAGDVTLDIRVGHFDELKSREPYSFMLNPDARALMTDLSGQDCAHSCNPYPLERRTPELADGWDLPGCPRLCSVDHHVTIVEVKRGGEAIGRMVFLAVHPTVLTPSTPLYSADFVGYAVTRLERELGHDQVVAFFNGPEGDVVPRRTSRDYLDLMHVGEKLYRALHETYDAPIDSRSVDVTNAGIDVRAEDILGHDATCTGCNSLGCGPTTLAKAPNYGAAAFGGGEDDHTVLHDLGWRDGVRDRDQHGQGPKLPPLDSRIIRAFKISSLIAPASHFPQRIPLTVASLGDFTFATFPTEMNTAQGLRVRQLLGPERTKLALVGLADEYIGYTATSAEYWRQDYMGASTIWGPYQGDFIACRLNQLRVSTNQASAPMGTRGYSPGPPPADEFGIDFLGDRTARPDDELDAVLLDEDHVPKRDLPTFEWGESCPRHCASDDTCAMDRRHVTMERWQNNAWAPAGDADGAPDDDRGFRILVVARGRTLGAKRKDPQQWAAIWTAPLLAPETSGRFRFHVDTCAPNSPRCSTAFDVPASAPLVLRDEDCRP